MRRILLGTLVLLTGCASSNLGVADNPQRLEVRSGDMRTVSQFTFVLTPEDRVVSSGVKGTPEQAWTAVGQTYQALGLAVTRLEPAQRLIGSQPSVAGRRLAGEALSAALDCGVNAAHAPIVNAYTVTVAITTKITPTRGDSTLVETLVQARAQDPVHNNPAVSCTSTGHLEARIAADVRQRVGG
jgi:hypothetical protein